MTVTNFTTTGAAAAVSLSGTDGSATLQPGGSNPGTAPITLTSTRYAGDTESGLLTFQPPDPTACGGAGVTTAAINGVAGQNG